MPKAQSPIDVVEVAVAVIMRGQEKPAKVCREILAVYNPHWREFSLPMTKRRRWEDPNMESGERREEWVDAAARAVAEYLGETCQPVFLMDIGEYAQSDRDGRWKHYRLLVFGVFEHGAANPVPGTIWKWMPPSAFHDENPVPQSELSEFELTAMIRLPPSKKREEREDTLRELTRRDKTLRPISPTARYVIWHLVRRRPELFR